MKIKSRIGIFILMFLLFPIIGKAATTTCDSDELARLQTLANSIQVVYEFDDSSKTYNITINGFSSDFYILDKAKNQYIKYSSEKSVTLQGYTPGDTINFAFYCALYNGCRDTYILTKPIYLPAYNPYSESALCDGYETYELCKKFTPIKIDSQAEFETRMKQYIQSLKNNDDNNGNNEQPTVTKSWWDKALDFFITYNLYFLVPIIVGGTITIIILEVRKKKSIL